MLILKMVKENNIEKLAEISSQDPHMKELYTLVTQGANLIKDFKANLPEKKGCPNEEDFAAFIDNNLPANQYEGILGHVAKCGYCLYLIGEYLDQKAD